MLLATQKHIKTFFCFSTAAFPPLCRNVLLCELHDFGWDVHTAAGTLVRNHDTAPKERGERTFIGGQGENEFSAPGKPIKEKRTVAFENLVKGNFCSTLSLSLSEGLPLVGGFGTECKHKHTAPESDRCINISNEGENIK